MLSVRLNSDLEEKLEQLSIKTNRSKSFYVKEALENYLNDMEDYFDAKSRDSNSEKNMLNITDLEEYLDD
ncbi:MAG: ribbon-helix-helix domain-containing protein [PS1 clade bacterium]